MDERRIAGLIDAGCLFFAYGGFLMLFGSLGGEFTLSKLSAAVCVATFVIVYLQYFALFTVFGGTTPGMMLRGLQVISFSGEPPTPRQMLWRSAGYMLSAGTFLHGVSLGHVGRRCTHLARPFVPHVSLSSADVCRHGNARRTYALTSARDSRFLERCASSCGMRGQCALLLSSCVPHPLP